MLQIIALKTNKMKERKIRDYAYFCYTTIGFYFVKRENGVIFFYQVKRAFIQNYWIFLNFESCHLI